MYIAANCRQKKFYSEKGNHSSERSEYCINQGIAFLVSVFNGRPSTPGTRQNIHVDRVSLLNQGTSTRANGVFSSSIDVKKNTRASNSPGGLLTQPESPREPNRFQKEQSHHKISRSLGRKEIFEPQHHQQPANNQRALKPHVCGFEPISKHKIFSPNSRPPRPSESKRESAVGTMGTRSRETNLQINPNQFQSADSRSSQALPIHLARQMFPSTPKKEEEFKNKSRFYTSSNAHYTNNVPVRPSDIFMDQYFKKEQEIGSSPGVRTFIESPEDKEAPRLETKTQPFYFMENHQRPTEDFGFKNEFESVYSKEEKRKQSPKWMVSTPKATSGTSESLFHNPMKPRFNYGSDGKPSNAPIQDSFFKKKKSDFLSFAIPSQEGNSKPEEEMAQRIRGFSTPFKAPGASEIYNTSPEPHDQVPSLLKGEEGTHRVFESLPMTHPTSLEENENFFRFSPLKNEIEPKHHTEFPNEILFPYSMENDKVQASISQREELRPTPTSEEIIQKSYGFLKSPGDEKYKNSQMF